MKTPLKAALSLLGILLLIPAAALAEINEGNWEIKTEMKMEGMPVQMPPTRNTMQQCLTNKDLVANATGSQKDTNCVMKDQKFSGGKGSWKMRCEHKSGSSDSEGEITYKGDTYKGKIVTKTTTEKKRGKKDRVMLMTITMSGKRLGACKK